MAMMRERRSKQQTTDVAILTPRQEAERSDRGVPERPAAAPYLLDLPAAAKYLSVTPWFVRSAIYRQKLPAIKAGKKYVISRIELEKFADRLMKGAA